MNSSDKNLKEISDWLVECALVERPIRETLQLFAEKLIHSNVPVHRINCSTFQRHQIMGAVDTTWEADTGTQETEFISKSVIQNENIFKTPAGELARRGLEMLRYDLRNHDTRAKLAAFEKLYSRGYSDYIILNKSYGRQWKTFGRNLQSEGVFGSFSTKHQDGFDDNQINDIKSIWPQFSLFLKTSTERLLSVKLLEAYVGILPAKNILNGMIEHGDGSKINCVLWYSDLRNSTKLSTSLSTDEYLKLLNRYFDCTAGSVIEHGGEVLKLIGDGVMAIFPFQPGEEKQACSKALLAARHSLTKAKTLQTDGSPMAIADLQFGIGLHIGEVILGNVGTAGRLDMTVTGLSANQVTRVESLTKLMSLSVLASPQFFKAHQNGLTSIGQLPIPDFGGMTEIFSLIEK